MCGITGNVDSNVTRRRADKGQLSVLLDVGLLDVVRRTARERGVTLSGLVEQALEVECHAGTGVGPGGGGGAAVQGGDSGHADGLVGQSPVVRDSFGRGELAAATPDWGSIFAAGREAKQALVGGRDVTSQTDNRVIKTGDPLMEIA